MGQIADDTINGLCCQLCGVYFDEPHYHPVVCIDCWRDLDGDERVGYILALNEEL